MTIISCISWNAFTLFISAIMHSEASTVSSAMVVDTANENFSINSKRIADHLLNALDKNLEHSLLHGIIYPVHLFTEQEFSMSFVRPALTINFEFFEEMRSIPIITALRVYGELVSDFVILNMSTQNDRNAFASMQVVTLEFCHMKGVHSVSVTLKNMFLAEDCPTKLFIKNGCHPRMVFISSK